MKISQEQLSDNLKQPLAPVYLVSGDEPLLIEESIQQIRQAAKTQNFNEREVWHADAKFDWNNLLASANSLSLFSEKTLIEIRLTSDKLSETGKKAVFMNGNLQRIFSDYSQALTFFEIKTGA